MPCAVGLIVLAAPVMSLLGGYSGHPLTLAAQLMTVLGVCIAFYALFAPERFVLYSSILVSFAWK